MAIDLVPVRRAEDVLDRYRGTPVGELLGYHCLRWPERTYARAPLVVVACMDCRVQPRVPRTFAYVLRTAGGRVAPVLFDLDYAVAVAGVETIAVIGHDDCAMTGVRERRSEFVRGLMARGWAGADAEDEYDRESENVALVSSRESVMEIAGRLEARYRGVLAAPLYATVRDGGLAQLVRRDGA